MRPLLISIAAVLVVFAAPIWAAGKYLLRPASVQLGSAPDGAVEISINSDSGALLRGWLFPVEQPRGAVVLMHGVRSNRISMSARARFMNRLGLTALTFDFQAHVDFMAYDPELYTKEVGAFLSGSGS